jgi:hypothetical protein
LISFLQLLKNSAPKLNKTKYFFISLKIYCEGTIKNRRLYLKPTLKENSLVFFLIIQNIFLDKSKNIFIFAQI